MPFNFPKSNKENKAQWHFPLSRSRNGYDPNEDDIPTDVLGSYTGTPYDGERPIQDADDL